MVGLDGFFPVLRSVCAMRITGFDSSSSMRFVYRYAYPLWSPRVCWNSIQFLPFRVSHGPGRRCHTCGIGRSAFLQGFFSAPDTDANELATHRCFLVPQRAVSGGELLHRPHDRVVDLSDRTSGTTGPKYSCPFAFKLGMLPDQSNRVAR
jgi:hypothetical protein